MCFLHCHGCAVSCPGFCDHNWTVLNDTIIITSSTRCFCAQRDVYRPIFRVRARVHVCVFVCARACVWLEMRVSWFKKPSLGCLHCQSAIAQRSILHWGLVSCSIHGCMIFFVSFSFILWLSNLLLILKKTKQNKRKKRKKLALCWCSLEMTGYGQS